MIEVTYAARFAGAPRGLGEGGEGGVVKLAVGGKRGAAVGAVLAANVGEAAAGLSHQKGRGGQIPERDLGLGSNVDSALGD